MPLILIIEDEPTTRVLHAQALAELPETTSVCAATIAEARSMLGSARPDLVLLDLRLPDGTGLDVLQMLTVLEPPPTVIVVSAFPEDLSSTVEQATRISVVRKPVSAGELRCRVLEVLRLSTGASPFSLPEYLQMACLGKHSVQLVVATQQQAGYVGVLAGEVWAAGFGQASGFEAFQLIVATPEAKVEARPWAGDVARQLVGGYEELLLEAFRRLDERGRDDQSLLVGDELDFSDLLQSLPPGSASDARADAHFPKPSAQDRPSCADLVALGVRAVIAREYALAVQWLTRARELDPKNAAIVHRLERLRELGYGVDEPEAESDVA